MKKTISIFLSILILASSSGIAYAQHFCSGMEMIAEITLGERHLSCGMEETTTTSCDDAVVVEDGHCCQNQFTTIHTDDNFAKASFDISFNKTFIATFVSVFVLQEVEITSTKNIFFADYTPPPLEQDLNILYDTFLI